MLSSTAVFSPQAPKVSFKRKSRMTSKKSIKKYFSKKIEIKTVQQHNFEVYETTSVDTLNNI